VADACAAKRGVHQALQHPLTVKPKRLNRGVAGHLQLANDHVTLGSRGIKTLSA
jgi:hypothetical protein